MPYVTDYTALTTGVWRWNKADRLATPTVVTYSFLETSELPSQFESPPAAGGYFDNSYKTLTAAERAAVRVAFSEYEANSGLRFVEVSDPSQASLQFLGNRASHVTSWAYYPTVTNTGGDYYAGSSFVTLTSDPARSWSGDVSRGGSLFTVMIHEIGHAIGLAHPHEGILLDPALDNHDNTIMSYDWVWSGWASGRARDTLARLDIDAIKYLYGDSAGFTLSWREAGQFVMIDGGEGNDRIVTGAAASFMLGGAGNDWLFGMQANDTLRGGDGTDRLDGGAGDDRALGENGADILLGGTGNDTIWGGLDNDRLLGEQGDDRLFGDAGNDTLAGGDGANWLSGGAGRDSILGGGSNDTILGGADHDILLSGNGDDQVIGGLGNDQIDGGLGLDRLTGQDGQDTIRGGAGNDRIDGGADDDLLIGGRDNDNILGQDGADRLLGEHGSDLLDGGGQNDTLDGGEGRDRLFGGEGADVLRGGAGSDRLDGGLGNNILFGGADADVFLFNEGTNIDRIADWQDGLDRISLTALPGYDGFDDVTAWQRGADVVIRLGVGSAIVLVGTDLASLDARDFLF